MKNVFVSGDGDKFDDKWYISLDLNPTKVFFYPGLQFSLILQFSYFHAQATRSQIAYRNLTDTTQKQLKEEFCHVVP